MDKKTSNRTLTLTLRDSDSYFGKLSLADGSRLTDPYAIRP